MTIWKPDLKGRKGPKYLQIADAISEAIDSGELMPGTQLTPQRILAYELDVSPNTTSRAYAECVNRGQLYGEVGKGSFVKIPQREVGHTSGLNRSDRGPIDLSRNLPFSSHSSGYLTETLKQLGSVSDLEVFLSYQTSEGDLRHHLEAGRKWLGLTGVKAAVDEIVITSGAQHGLFSTLMSFTSRGDTILVEELTYPPVRLMTQRLGLKVQTVEIDQEGLIPEALDKTCKSRKVWGRSSIVDTKPDHEALSFW